MGCDDVVRIDLNIDLNVLCWWMALHVVSKTENGGAVSLPVLLESVRPWLSTRQPRSYLFSFRLLLLLVSLEAAVLRAQQALRLREFHPHSP